MNPRSIVAFMLGACVVLFFSAGVGVNLMRALGYEVSGNANAFDIWADLVKTIIGGLIGYIAGQHQSNTK